MMFIIDVLRYDFETVGYLLDLLNDEGSIGWRFAWKSAFAEGEVVDALEQLVTRGLVECYEDNEKLKELVLVKPPDDLRRAANSIWFRLTNAGRQAWEQWDDPPLNDRDK